MCSARQADSLLTGLFYASARLLCAISLLSICCVELKVELRRVVVRPSWVAVRSLSDLSLRLAYPAELCLRDVVFKVECYLLIGWLFRCVFCWVLVKTSHSVLTVILRDSRQPWGGRLDPPRARTDDGPHEYVSWLVVQRLGQ